MKLPQWIRVKKSGIIGGPGKASSAPIESSRKESKELKLEIDIQPPVDIGRIIDALSSSMVSVYTATERLTVAMTGTWDACSHCKHERKHHNPDKRMKSGVGRCVCGGCRKFSDPFANIDPFSSSYISSGFYTSRPISTAISSGSNFLSNSSSNTYTKSISTSISMKDYNSCNNPMSIAQLAINRVLQKSGMTSIDPNRVVITSVDIFPDVSLNSYGIRVDYYEVI